MRRLLVAGMLVTALVTGGWTAACDDPAGDGTGQPACHPRCPTPNPRAGDPEPNQPRKPDERDKKYRIWARVLWSTNSYPGANNSRQVSITWTAPQGGERRTLDGGAWESRRIDVVRGTPLALIANQVIKYVGPKRGPVMVCQIWVYTPDAPRREIPLAAEQIPDYRPCHLRADWSHVP